MSQRQRNKGAGAERELAQLLHLHLGVRCRRNLEQVRSGGCDLVPDPEASGPVADALGRFAIECKRYSRATPSLLRAWWQQAAEQARRASLWPILAYREDRGSWRLVVPLPALCPTLGVWDDIDLTAELSVPAFAAMIREMAE